eukprot:13084189-Heterocapsa_arctica.AAC.1
MPRRPCGYKLLEPEIPVTTSSGTALESNRLGAGRERLTTPCTGISQPSRVPVNGTFGRGTWE